MVFNLEVLIMTILIIDDNAIQVSLMRLYLERYPDFILFSAYNVLDGIQIFQNNQIDLCLLDLSLPGQDGTVFLDFLNSLEIQIPVILITGVHFNLIKEISKKYNTYYLRKPFIEEELIKLIHQITGKIKEK